MSIKQKLTGGFVILFMLQIIVGIYGITSILKIREIYKVEEEENKNYIVIEKDIKDGQLAFKKQVQEWKNILIRGNDKESFEKYLKSFNEEEKNVQEKLKKI